MIPPPETRITIGYVPFCVCVGILICKATSVAPVLPDRTIGLVAVRVYVAPLGSPEMLVMLTGAVKPL